jgi:methionyl-tRNA formyltransferase
MLRVVFMATPEFALPSLEAILAAGYEVPLVVTVPDRPKGRGRHTAPSAVRRAAEEHGIGVATPESLKDPEFLDQIRLLEPDVICVVAFRILPEILYSIPRLGSFNLHGSLLPKYRGAAPINWAIINGEGETGVTTFFLQRKVDTGSTILQKSIPISDDMTAGELHDIMMGVGADVVVETLRLIESGSVEPVVQDDTAATPAPKIFREDCRIDWNSPSVTLHNMIRGLSPHPGAFTSEKGSLLKILRTRLAKDQPAVAAGEIRVSDGRLFVGTADSPLELLQIQQEGKRPLDVSAFLRGHSYEEGTLLGT